MNYIACFTDGAAKGNSKNSPAGWGWWIPVLKKSDSGSFKGTNNVAELTALKELLRYVLSNKLNSKIIVYTDSSYVIGVFTKSWNIKANAELIEEIRSLGKDVMRITGKKIKLIHVDAHTGKDDFLSINNAIVDKLASDAAKKSEA